MKLKAVVLVAIPVLLIAAAALFYWYIRAQSIAIIDDPAPVSSQPVEQTPIDNVIIPEIAVPVPDGNQQPTQDDALTPETVLPDASTPEVKPDVKDDKQPNPPPDKPTGGEKKDGKIYMPGFGWIDDYGGGVEVETANNAGTGDIIGY